MLIDMFKLLLLTLLYIDIGVTVPPANLNTPDNIIVNEDVKHLKYVANSLAVQLEKWNGIFLSSLEPRMAASAVLLESINSNVHNLQERAHVWDTFQLHVSAWNDQLATLDRKFDIISKGQDKMNILETKINSILGLDYKLDGILSKLDKIQIDLTELSGQKQASSNDLLFGEFAARGILSTIKTVERKLDKLMVASHQHASVIKTKSGNGNDQSRLIIKCNTPRSVEDTMRDILFKVDVVLDKLSAAAKRKDNADEEYEIADYGDRNEEMPQEVTEGQSNQPRKKTYNNQDLLIDSAVDRILKVTNSTFEKLYLQCQSLSLNPNISLILQSVENFNNTLNEILDGHFRRQASQFEALLLKKDKPRFIACPLNGTLNVTDDKIELLPQHTFNASYSNNINTSLIDVSNKESCEDLDYNDWKSGIYVFGNNSSTNSSLIRRQYCEIRNDGLWTVIQRRDNYKTLQNFSLTWSDYKTGFGDLNYDFWLGNDLIHKLSSERPLTLRIELEDFENNSVWAEYNIFHVQSEADNYRLIVGGYRGNSSDSLTSHNNSLFSTLDRTNDEAPDCCPCAVSYGGGWWFNKCFESNLNGVYHRQSHNNEYYKGIIWEHWLGNYSLKKAQMMVKSKGRIHSSESDENTTHLNRTDDEVTYYEEP